MIARILKWLIAIVLVTTIGIATAMRMVGDDPAAWHVDPTTVERTGKPNDYLVAPEGKERRRIVGVGVHQRTDRRQRDAGLQRAPDRPLR